MLIIGNYQVTESIYQSSSSIVYSAQDIKTKQPVILKLLNTSRPSPAQLEQFTKEYNIFSSFNDDDVVKAYHLEKYNDSLLIVMEDFYGGPLSKDISSFKLKIGWFLETAIRLTQILETIHEKKLVHKDFTPDNIIYNSTTKQLKVIDFSIAESIPSSSLPTLEGSLPYIAPEQTGRINQNIDYRTDLYTLGATLYHLLTGVQPFQTSDPMELIHFHLAKDPTPAHKTHTKIPPIVSQIISKLMEKSADNRYQSCSGVRADLQKCLRLLKSTSPLVSFELGRKDSGNAFKISNALFGRRYELDTANEMFVKPTAETPQILLIKGQKGTGKTSFAEHLKELFRNQGDYFVTGSFYKETVFGPIINALQDYIRQIFTEEQAKVSEWKKQLTLSLQDEARVITDILPEIETLLGHQPPLSILPPTETVARFTKTLKTFIQTSTPKHSSLVIFLDDLQWAAPPTIDLLQAIVSDEKVKNLKFILTNTTGVHEEVGDKLFTRLTANSLKEIHLKSLTIQDINKLLTETINVPSEDAYPLAETLKRKTGGNPFQLRQYLLHLHHKGYFQVDSVLGAWRFNHEKIKLESITENVVQKLKQQIQHLPDQLSHTLQTASCLNGPFNPEHIETLNPASKTKQHLKQAEKFGFLEIIVNKETPKTTEKYTFSHEEIKSAFYENLKDEQRKTIHLKIGRLLLQESGSQNLFEDHAYEIADQLNSAKESINKESENLELVKINLQAAKVAEQRGNAKRTFSYLQHAKKLLSSSCWETNHELSLKTHLKLCKASSQVGEIDLTGEITALILEHSQTLDVKIEAYTIHLQALKSTNRLNEALQVGLEALELLGIRLPESPSTLYKAITIIMVRSILLFKGTRQLSKLPKLDDQVKLAAIRFLLEISPIAYSTKPDLLPFISHKAMLITLKYGSSQEATAAGFALFGLLQCTSKYGNIKKGIEFGDLALNLHSKLQEQAPTSITPFLVNNFLLHWSKHIEESVAPLKEIYNISIEKNDLDGIVSTANSISYRLLLSGINLNKVASELEYYRRVIDKSGQQILIYRQMIYQQIVDNLLGNSADPTIFTGAFYNEKRLRHLHELEHDQTTLFQLHLAKLIHCYIFKHFDDGLTASTIAEANTPGTSGSLLIPLLHFYDSLTRLAVFNESSSFNQNYTYRKVEKNQKLMRKWAKHAPMNYRHKYLLVEAEIARVQKNRHLALDLYDRAIVLAKENKYLQEEALIHECLANFYKEEDKKYLYNASMKEARYCYRLWGATAKVEQIDTYDQSPLDSKSAFTNENLLSESDQLPKTRLDMMAVIKASRTLTGEIVLEELLKKMLQIMIENAGAQKGFLLFLENGNWVVRASGSIVLVDTSVKILSGTIAEHKDELSQAVIHYVARTREVAVLNDATKQGLFSNDEYIMNKKPKSILCAPIIHQGQISCIVYLENNLTARAFPPERQETLNILGTQAAISLKNSTLYSDLGRTVEQLHKEIEKRKETQNQLLHAEKLTALGRLSASIAHEFGNPLMGIRYLLEDFHSRLKLPREDHELLEIGLEECNRMKNLMNELHQLDKPSTGKSRVFNLNQSIENVLTFQKKLLTSKNITVVTQFNDSPLNVVAIEDQITQVLINLLMNAADAIPPKGGTITISTKHVKGWVTITIHDTGVGIKKENQEKIFEPFFSTKPEVEGTGLGLPTSYGIITSHGGDIICKSSPKLGTKFTVKLPSGSNSPQ